MTGDIAEMLVIAIYRFLSGAIVRDPHDSCSAGAAVFFANHTSHLDTLAIMSALPGNFRRVLHPVAAGDYWDGSRFLRFLSVYVLRCILIDRVTARREDFRKMTDVLRRGESLLIFPEGTRSRDGRIGHFHGGMALLAKICPEVPFIPVYLRGLDKTLPKGEWLPVPNMSEIRFGRPLRPHPGESREDFIVRCRAELEKTGEASLS